MSSETANTIRIAARGSELALLQVAMVGARLRAAYAALGFGRPNLIIETTRTIGDQSREDWAARARGLDADTRGRKWTLEVEAAIADGSFDLAVHSGKDLPNKPYEGTVYLPVLEREDARDVFIPRERGVSLRELPQGAVIGTNSARRRGELRSLRADLRFADYAGNVPTRLSPARMADKNVDGAVMAAAGLKRLRLYDGDCMQPLAPEEMLPSGTQGIVAAQIKEDAAPELRSALETLQHLPTVFAWEAERAFLGAFGAGCETPISVYAEPIYDEKAAAPAVFRFDASVPQTDGRPTLAFSSDQIDVRGLSIGELGDKARASGADLARVALDAGADKTIARPEDFPSVSG